jgi:hypothetical protein
MLTEEDPCPRLSLLLPASADLAARSACRAASSGSTQTTLTTRNSVWTTLDTMSATAATTA